MSYSILNNKYQKWTDLLADEPDNADYKHKVHKYTSLLKKTHVGGNANNSTVDELLDKIDNAVNKQMDGGSGSKITGYRNMKGGNETNTKVAELTKDIFNEKQKQEELKKQQKKYIELANTTIPNATEQKLKQLKNNIQSQEQEIKNIQNNIRNKEEQLNALTKKS